MARITWTMVTAIVPRVLFSLHTVIVVWRTSVVFGNSFYWFFVFGLAFMVVELIIVIVRRHGHEWKWFCPSVLLYLCTVVPAIWLLKLKSLADKGALIYPVKSQRNDPAIGLYGFQLNLDQFKALSEEMWVLAIEQTLLFLLIIGRWILPKGDISRDQLSQLLFVYIGIASDITEIFVLFEEQNVLCNKVLNYMILGAWSLSLFQYTLVLTVTQARKTRVVGTHTLTERTSRARESTCCRLGCCEKETWAILTTVCLQDLPFFCLRMYVMIRYKLLSYNVLFFTFKNALVIGLQIYRICVLSCPQNDKSADTSVVTEGSESKQPSTRGQSPRPTAKVDVGDRDEKLEDVLGEDF